MRPTQDTYPVFEANQVLTNAHLNQALAYADEQTRLTRAALLGIGIVCGLETRLETTAGATTLHLSKGCGVTSEGYLLVEPDDVALVAYRAGFTVPPTPGYAPLLDPGSHAQYPLWELFEAGEPNVQALGSPSNFLDDKALLLFLELKQESLRNCSPNNCDDKGAAVTVTVRRLLVRVADAAKMIAAVSQEYPEDDLEATLLARLSLPDLRLPRYDVPSTSPATSAEVLAGFHAVFHATKLVQQTAAALTAAYQAFGAVLEPPLAANPFAGFAGQFGFLDAAPTTTAQVRFLPYYYDFFGDLLQAYDELRWKGAELLCACCPAEGLFPRHLLAGALRPELAAGSAGAARQRFLPSAASSGYAEATQEVGQLFRRLVALTTSFTAAPPLAAARPAATDAQIKLVPSTLADAPLSAKAIPYYYVQTGTPPLYQLWSPLKSRRQRAFHTLSYRANEYAPPAPAFVTDPLRYDLEPYNFLRVEGHLGKPYQSALSTLLDLRARHRLPIDVIALRTGAFDETLAVDLSQATARFQDLEALYDTLREETLTELAEGTRFLYNTATSPPDQTGPKPVALPLLKKYAPGLQYLPNTVGAWFEKNLAALLALPYIDIDQAKVSDNTIWTVYCLLFQHAAAPPKEFYPHVVAVYYFAKLVEVLPDSLSALNLADLTNKYEDLVALVRYFRSEAAANFPTELAAFRPQEELIDHFDQVLFGCKLAPLRTLRAEYQRRLRELKQQQFLSSFLRANPGIQHKAGVPLGGTFILVYHDDPAPVLSPTVFTALATNQALLTKVNFSQARSSQLAAPTLDAAALATTLTRIRDKMELAADPDIRLLLGSLTGTVPDLRRPLPGRDSAADKIIKQAVAELADGTVIADFYLPYLCRAEGGVQFVLPKPPPTFTVAVGCTNASQQAEVTLTPAGGLPPYSYQADGGDFQPLSGVLLLREGSHSVVIRDAEATASAPQTVVVAGLLTLGEPEYKCVGDRNEYVATAVVSGGTPPYAASRGTISADNQYVSETLPGGQDVAITITDSRQCQATRTLAHSCLPPLAFSTQVGCTASRRQLAPVQVVPTGGQPPYQVQVDTQPFAPLAGPLTLPVGTHQVAVRDAAGTVAATQAVMVWPPLTLAALKFECQGTATYKAQIQITGGQPPYSFGGLKLTTNTFTTGAVASGQSVRVEVTDQNNCSAQLEVTHTCEQACTLPCAGLSRRGAYRLWVQPTTKGSEYAAYRADDSKVTLRYNGTAFELPAGLVAMPVAGLNGKFNDTVGDTIKKLNKVIAEKIGQGMVELSYQPAATDPFAVLWIEHFTCETFSLDFDYVVIGQNDQTLALNAQYTNKPDSQKSLFDGVRFSSFSMKIPIMVPAFNYADRDQCAKTPAKAVCEGRKIEVKATWDQGKSAFTGAVAGVADQDVVAWVWDLPGSQPASAFYLGKTVTPVLPSSSGQARLTVITKDGCVGTVLVDYSIGKP